MFLTNYIDNIIKNSIEKILYLEEIIFLNFKLIDKTKIIYCNICLQNNNNNNENYKCNNCMITFHKKCLQKYLNISNINNCMHCKYEFKKIN
jgi:hypothetical protein